MQKSLSRAIIEFFNSYKTGKKVSRKELMGHLIENFHTYNVATMDVYRKALMEEGYLSKTGKRGVYKINRKIPKGETISNMRQGQQAWKASRPQSYSRPYPF